MLSRLILSVDGELSVSGGDSPSHRCFFWRLGAPVPEVPIAEHSNLGSCSPAVIFAPSIVLFHRRLVRNEPQLTIRTDGIVDNGSRLRVAFIPWSEIETVSVAGSRQQYVALTLRHPEEVLPRLGVLKRAMLFLDRSIVKADVILPTGMLPYSSQEVVDLLKACAKQYGG